MANLGPQHINQSFGDLLQLPNGLTSAIQNVQDGSGNVTPLEISTTAVDLPIVGPDGSGMLSDLGGASGSNFIGFQQAGTGAVLLTLQDKAREWVSVMDFGAVGDGVHNDTAAIQAANNAAAGKCLYFPSGIYLFDGLIPNSNTTYRGDGNGTTLALRSGNKNIISNWNSGVPVLGLTNIEVCDLVMDGLYNTHADPLNDNFSIGVFILYASYINVHNVEFKNFWFGAMNIFGCQYFQIQNNTATNCGDKNTYLGYYEAIQIDGAGSSEIDKQGKHGIVTGNMIVDCGGGIRSNGAATVSSTSYDYVVCNNIIRAPKVAGIWFFDSYGVITIANNHIETSGKNGIRVESTNSSGSHPYYAPRNVKIVGNTIRFPNQDAINGTPAILTSCYEATLITGNMITNLPANTDGIQCLAAIDIDGSTGNSAPQIISNTIRGGTSNLERWGIQCNMYFGMIAENVISGAFANGGGIQLFGVGNQIRSNKLLSITGSVLQDNASATKFGANYGYVTYNSGITAVADGGSISHGLAGAPNSIIVSPYSSSDVIVAVTTSNATTFTVRIVDRATGNAAGITNISWQAQMTGNE